MTLVYLSFVRLVHHYGFENLSAAFWPRFRFCSTAHCGKVALIPHSTNKPNSSSLYSSPTLIALICVPLPCLFFSLFFCLSCFWMSRKINQGIISSFYFFSEMEISLLLWSLQAFHHNTWNLFWKKEFWGSCIIRFRNMPVFCKPTNHDAVIGI